MLNSLVISRERFDQLNKETSVYTWMQFLDFVLVVEPTGKRTHIKNKRVGSGEGTDLLTMKTYSKDLYEGSRDDWTTYWHAVQVQDWVTVRWFEEGNKSFRSV